MRTSRTMSIALGVCALLSSVGQIFFGVMTWSGSDRLRTPEGGQRTMLAMMRGPSITDSGGALEFGLTHGILDGLELSAEQRKAIHAILNAYRDRAERERETTMTAGRALMQTIHGVAFDQSKIRRAAAVVAAREADGFVTQATLLQEIRAVLTPDQRHTLQQVLSRAPHW